MNDGKGNPALARALELSHEMIAVAEHGDASAVASLDAERLRLLDSQRHRSRHLDADERLMMQKISELNGLGEAGETAGLVLGLVWLSPLMRPLPGNPGRRVREAVRL